MKYIYIIVCFLFYGSALAQVQVSGSIDAQGQNPLVSLYADGLHQLVNVTEQGKFNCTIPRYEEAILIFYGVHLLPQTISLNTEATCQEKITLSVRLEKGEIKDTGYLIAGPSKRIVTQQGGFLKRNFELDHVKDKQAFAKIMAVVSKNTKAFYQNRTIPLEVFSPISSAPEKNITKVSHQLGENIFDLLNQKKALKRQIEFAQKNYRPQATFDATQCQTDLALLKKEATFAQIEFDLASYYLEKEELAVRRAELNGQTSTNRGVLKARKTLEVKKGLLQIAQLNLENKTSDCQELQLQEKLDNTLSAATVDTQAVSIKKNEISNIYLDKRIKNARTLTKQHNAMANNLTGRERVVQLCYAQKYIAEQEELKLYKQANIVSIWKNKNTSGQYTRQVEAAQQSYNRQREVAWQAEMGYLEHVWHLRDEPDAKGTLDDIYNRQDDLLTVHLIKKETLEETTTTENANTILADIKIDQTTDTRGEIASLQMQEDHYEIIIKQNGQKSYYKNGKPITKLTYRFETQRKFGEMLQNIRHENEKTSLWKFFKEKIQI